MQTLRRAVDRVALERFEAPTPWLSLAQVAGTLVPLGAIWWLTAALVQQRGWWWSFVFCVPSTVFRTRAMLLQHDAGHHSLFLSAAANDALGSLLGVLTWAPYLYWRRTHAMHHVNSSRLEGRDELGSITTLTVDEYLALTPTRQHLYRVSRNPWAFCFLGGLFQFVLKHHYPWDMPRSWRREWHNVWATNAASLLLWSALSVKFGVYTVVAVETPILLFSGAAAVWLIFIQHVYEGGFFARGEEWTLEKAALTGSSFYQLPALLEWCTLHVGYHHIHHLAPRIPNYRLKAAHLANPHLQVPALTLRKSLECWHQELWDERMRRFVRFPRPFAPQTAQSGKPGA